MPQCIATKLNIYLNVNISVWFFMTTVIGSKGHRFHTASVTEAESCFDHHKEVKL